MILQIRPMSQADLAIAIGWAADEGWNPGLGDAGPFRAEDPEGFLMGWLGDQPVASISVVRYGAGFGFLGFYIVVPRHRGRGHGLALWRAGMARLEGRVVGLDGVVGQQANYARSGYVLAHRNIRFGGEVAVDAPRDPRLRAPGDLEAIIGFDRMFFPAPRDRFLRAWLTAPARRSARCLPPPRPMPKCCSGPWRRMLRRVRCSSTRPSPMPPRCGWPTVTGWPPASRPPGCIVARHPNCP
jgi:hypothetical protein